MNKQTNEALRAFSAALNNKDRESVQRIGKKLERLRKLEINTISWEYVLNVK